MCALEIGQLLKPLLPPKLVTRNIMVVEKNDGERKSDRYGNRILDDITHNAANNVNDTCSPSLEEQSSVVGAHVVDEPMQMHLHQVVHQRPLRTRHGLDCVQLVLWRCTRQRRPLHGTADH